MQYSRDIKSSPLFSLLHLTAKPPLPSLSPGSSIYKNELVTEFLKN